MRRDVQAIRLALQRLSVARPMASLFADGSVRNAVSGDSAQPGAATGSIGVAVAWPNGSSISISVAVASSVDTVRSGFGGVILSPGSGRGNLSNFLVDARTPRRPLRQALRHHPSKVLRFFRNAPWIPLGIHVYVSGSNSLWRVVSGVDTTIQGTDTAFTERSRVSSAAVVGHGIGLTHDWIDHKLLNTPIRLTTEILLARRLLRGNIRGDTLTRQLALGGTDAIRFSGLEYGILLQIGAVSAGVQYYSFKGRSSGIPNLGNGQLVIGLSVAGNVISGALDREP